MRLRWKLTLSYTLVTAGAILLIEIALLIGAVLVLARPGALSRLLVPVISDGAAEIAPLLEARPPDRAALETWLTMLVKEGRLGGTQADNGVKINLNPASIRWAAALDANGSLVAAYPQGRCLPGAPLAGCIPSKARTLVDHALAGQRDSRQLSLSDNGALYLAAPIRGSHGEVVGALFLHIVWPASLQEWPRQILGTLLPSAAAITLFAALIGTLFGFLTARLLTHRLTSLTDAADAWSRGDFSIQVRDTSADELGMLARRLNRMAGQLENLLQARQELAALEARHRLARDLHDAVKQQVFAAGMQLATARRHLPNDPQAAQAALEQAEVLVQQTQEELATLIKELRPAALQGQGLAAALRTHIEAWSRQTGIEAKFHVQNEQRLPLETAQALLRVAQESLANVAKHSRANKVTVHLAWDEHEVRLTVEDNGQGFDAAARRGRGLGLHSMRERMAELGGTLEIITAPGEGTRLEARVPR